MYTGTARLRPGRLRSGRRWPSPIRKSARVSPMTKSELIEILSRRQAHLKADDVDMAVKTLLEMMGNALTEGERIEIRGFGSFSLHFRPPRLGRNPKTGDSVALPGKYVPHFKPGKELRERVSTCAGRRDRLSFDTLHSFPLDLPHGPLANRGTCRGPRHASDPIPRRLVLPRAGRRSSARSTAARPHRPGFRTIDGRPGPGC